MELSSPALVMAHELGNQDQDDLASRRRHSFTNNDATAAMSRAKPTLAFLPIFPKAAKLKTESLA